MEITAISPAQLAELHEKNPSLELIDVRTPAEFQAVHVTYARNAPLDRLDPAALAGQRTGGPNDPLYFVCQGGVRSRQACEKLLNAGFANVVNVEGGTKACVEAGLPVIRGKNALPLERQVRIAAGALVVLGCALGWWVHPAGSVLAAFVGAGLVASGITGACPMAIVIARMPWNQCGAVEDCSCRQG